MYNVICDNTDTFPNACNAFELDTGRKFPGCWFTRAILSSYITAFIVDADKVSFTYRYFRGTVLHNTK